MNTVTSTEHQAAVAPPTNQAIDTPPVGSRTAESPSVDLAAGGTVTLHGSTGTIHSPGLEKPITFHTGLSVPDAVVIDLSIMYLTMQSIMESTVDGIQQKNDDRKATFDEYINALKEKGEVSEEKCGGANVWMKVFQVVTIIASAAMLVGSLGTLGPVAIALATVALTFEVSDMITEAATGKSLIARGAERMAQPGGLMEKLGVPEEKREMVAAIILTVVVMLASVGPGMINGIRNAGSGIFRSMDDVAKAGAKAGRSAGKLATGGAGAVDDAAETAAKGAKAAKAANITDYDDIISKYGMKAIDDPGNPFRTPAWKSEMIADLQKAHNMSPQDAQKFANAFHRETAKISRLSAPARATAKAEVAGTRTKVEDLNPGQIKKANEIATENNYYQKALENPSGEWKDELVKDLMDSKKFTRRDEALAYADGLQDKAYPLAKNQRQADAVDQLELKNKDKVKADYDQAVSPKPPGSASSVAADATDAATTAISPGMKKAIDRLQAVMAELVHVVGNGTKGGGKVGQVSHKAYNALKGLLINDPQNVKMITRLGAFAELAGAMGMAVVGIKQGTKTIELAKIEKEIITLSTELEVTDKEIAYLTDIFKDFSEITGEIAHSMNAIENTRGQTYQRLV